MGCAAEPLIVADERLSGSLNVTSVLEREQTDEVRRGATKTTTSPARKLGRAQQGCRLPFVALQDETPGAVQSTGAGIRSLSDVASTAWKFEMSVQPKS
jgi:hypothetical protein